MLYLSEGFKVAGCQWDFLCGETHQGGESHPGGIKGMVWEQRAFSEAFFNTSGNIYKEMSLKDKLPSMSEDEQLALLATDGMLVKRPLVVGDGFVLTGFKEAEWKEKLL